MIKIMIICMFPLFLLASPQNPSNLVLTPSVNAVTIHWQDNASSETGYKIYRDGVLIYITGENITSYHDSALLPDNTYTYTVKATDDEEVGSAGTFFMQALTSEKHHVISDNSKNLMWVNEYEYAKHACLAVHGDRENDYSDSLTFCEQLNFAGASNWRDPNAEELTNFILQTNAENIEVGYLAPCKDLLAREFENGSETAVSTKHDDSRPLGTQKAFVPYEYNVGLRCVRDY